MEETCTVARELQGISELEKGIEHIKRGVKTKFGPDALTIYEATQIVTITKTVRTEVKLKEIYHGGNK